MAHKNTEGTLIGSGPRCLVQPVPLVGLEPTTHDLKDCGVKQRGLTWPEMELRVMLIALRLIMPVR